MYCLDKFRYSCFNNRGIKSFTQYTKNICWNNVKNYWLLSVCFTCYSVEDDLDELFLDQPKSKHDVNNGSPIKSKPALKPRPAKSLSEVPPTTKPDLQPKPKHGTKPDLKPKPTSKHSDVQEQAEAHSSAADLDTDDIMKYIQNAEETQDDVDLFAWQDFRHTDVYVFEWVCFILDKCHLAVFLCQ